MLSVSFLGNEAEAVAHIVINLDECMARLSACYLELATNDGEFLDFAIWGTEEHCHAIVRTGCRACNDEIDAVLHNRIECLCLPHHCDEGEQDGDDGFLVHYLLVIINFLQLLFDVLADQPTGKDGAVGGEEDCVGNTVEFIEVVGTILRVEDLRIGYLQLGDCFQGCFRLVFDGNTKYCQTFVLIFIIGCDKSWNPRPAGAAP